jgi:hypothetical protein
LANNRLCFIIECLFDPLTIRSTETLQAKEKKR